MHINPFCVLSHPWSFQLFPGPCNNAKQSSLLLSLGSPKNLVMTSEIEKHYIILNYNYVTCL